jgi:hypothetical protein
MTNQNKLINAGFQFIVEDIGNHQYMCSQLPDRIINITVTKPKRLLFTTDKLGKKIPMFNSECYTYTTTFNESGFSFSYFINKSSVMGNILGMPPLSPIEIIQNNMVNCYLNFVNEDHCKKALSFFNNNDSIEFGRKYTDGLIHFTLDTRKLENIGNIKKTISIHKSYIYDETIDTIYQNIDKAQNKFSELFQSLTFSNSWFFIYESIHSDAFKFNVFHRKQKQYIRVLYSSEQLTIAYLNDKTIERIIGDDKIHDRLEILIKDIIIDTPTEKLARYATEFDLDLSKLTIDEIKVLNMVDY